MDKQKEEELEIMLEDLRQLVYKYHRAYPNGKAMFLSDARALFTQLFKRD